MSEREIIEQILMAASEKGARLFRQNVGVGWAGKVVRATKAGMVSIQPGDVIIRGARPLHAGLATGSADIVGITPVTITQDMVGQTVGVFTSVEVKTGRVPTTKAQQRWFDMVEKMGGKAMIVRSVEEYGAE